PGHEEEIACRIFNKTMQAPDHFEIHSATRSASRPGWISVEVASLAAVQCICADMLNIFAHEIYFISADDAQAWHREPLVYRQRAQSWIRSCQHPYK
ncbi:hypothetical protein H0H81_005624, partial [Sphagnurus paluster]